MNKVPSWKERLVQLQAACLYLELVLLTSRTVGDKVLFFIDVPVCVIPSWQHKCAKAEGSSQSRGG